MQTNQSEVQEIIERVRHLFSSFLEEYFKSYPIEVFIKEFIQKRLEKKNLRDEYERMYEALSSMNIPGINIRNIVIESLAETYFTTEEEIKSILKLTRRSRENNLQQSNYNRALNL